MSASLVMRDRETDSWWSIMTSDAIGGTLEGAELDELPNGEKTTFGDWAARYPETLVLSVDGVEHPAVNPYDNYFASDKTFRDLEISDTRLEPKTPIFSFWLEDRAYAAAHESFESGRLFELGDDSARRLLLFRPRGASMFASTRAWLLDAFTAGSDLKELLAASEGEDFAGIPLDGFDTFWYSWIAINSDSVLLPPAPIAP